MNKIKEINKEINKTKRALKMYNCTFREYMKDSGRRDDIDLGDTIQSVSKDELCGIVIGWNGSCNYKVFRFSDSCIINMHPNSVELKKG